MAIKAETVKVTEKMSNLKDYDQILRQLVAEQQRERTDLDHQILLKKNHLLSIQEQIVKQQSEFEKWKRAETEKFNNDKTRKEGSFAERERAMRINEDNISKRLSELQQREERVKDLVDEKNALANERIEVEKMHRKSEELIKDAHTKLAEADNKVHRASMIETTIKDKDAKLQMLNKNLNTREEQVEIKLRDIKSREKNIEEVKKVIDPKMAELSTVESNIKSREKSITQKETELNAKLEEQRSILKSLEEREKKLKDRERNVLQKDEDLSRKALLAGIKD